MKNILINTSVFIILVLLNGCCLISNQHSSREGTQNIMDVLQEIEYGFDLDQVLAVLDSRAAEYSVHKVNPLVRGIFRDSETENKLVEKSILFDLYFDEKMKFLRYETREIFTGM